MNEYIPNRNEISSVVRERDEVGSSATDSSGGDLFGS